MLRKFPDRSAGDPGESIDPRELEAANWLVLHDRGLTPGEEQAFSRWRADERNAQLFDSLHQTWGLLDRVPVGRVEPPAHGGRKRRVWLTTIAAAAAIAVAFIGLTRSPDSGMSLARTAATQIGGLEKIQLPDGSVVHLNTASEVVFAFTAKERRVQLSRGEANFMVAKDPARPFIVRVGQVDVRAVGTVFNVRRHGGSVDVLVTEGKVRVDDARTGESLLESESKPTVEADSSRTSPAATGESRAATPPLLAAGHRVTVPFQIAASPVRSVAVPVAEDEASRALAWQSRYLEFDSEPLDNIVAEFNRYNRHRLVVEDPALGMQRFGGKFPADDFASFVRLLETNLDVMVERRASETILRLRPTATSGR